MSEKFIPPDDLAVRGILHLYPIGCAITQVESMGPLRDDAFQIALAHHDKQFPTLLMNMVRVQQS